MRIESVEWSSYHLSQEDLLESWVVAADIVAILKAVIKVKAASDEDISMLASSLKL